jgi:hypothetical protein
MQTHESETFALLALRRTLLQLAVLGVAAAVALPWIAPGSDTVAFWCALAPLSACTVHSRSLLASLLPMRRVRMTALQRS